MAPSLLQLAILLALPFVATAAPKPASDVQQSPYVAKSYLVELKPGADAGAHLAWLNLIHDQSIERSRSARVPVLAGVLRNFKIDSFQGYAGEFDDTEIAAIRARKDVVLVEQDAVVTTGEYQPLEPGPVQAGGLERRALTQQRGAQWPLSVVSQRPPVASNGTYFYDDLAGAGTYAYVLDTGINVRHVEFQGRASMAKYDAYPEPEAGDDGHGHGTHVAGIIGSRTYGVAKKTNLIGVRVLDRYGDGNTSTIVEGYMWTVNEILDKGRASNSIISMSIQGPRSEFTNRAVKAAYNKGILTVVCAGNYNEDVKGFSPASAPEAVTVGAIDQDANFTRAFYSNYGAGVDLFAVGTEVLSTYRGSAQATIRMSGTSMATPHVTGVALYLQALYKNLTPQKLRDKIIELASKGAVSGLPSGTPNNLVYNGSGK